VRFRISIFLALILNSLANAQENSPDLGAIANQFKACSSNLSQEANGVSKKEDLLIFVSFSMPEQSLKLWSQQAEKTGSNLILRGLINNSIQATTQNKIIGGFNIDPEMFQKYDIKTVPAVVLVKNNQYDVVYGDTSLESALEHIKHKGSAESKPMAQSYLNKMRHKNG
jgi:type-F conjugative transfer system pilin assembly protein TrbC